MSRYDFKKAFKAAEIGNVSDFKTFFNPQQVNKYSDDILNNRTLLSVACRNGHVEIVKLLLECDGINVNIGVS